MCCRRCDWIACPISPSKPAIRPAPKTMSVPIPFAIGAKNTDPASASATDDDDGGSKLEARSDDAVRRPAAGPVGDRDCRRVDAEDVQRRAHPLPR